VVRQATRRHSNTTPIHSPERAADRSAQSPHASGSARVHCVGLPLRRRRRSKALPGDHAFARESRLAFDHRAASSEARRLCRALRVRVVRPLRYPLRPSSFV